MFKIFYLQNAIIFFAVLADLETVKSLTNTNQTTNCFLKANRAKIDQLVKFKLKILRNEVNIMKLPIINKSFFLSSNVIRILDQKCLVPIEFNDDSCPSKPVLRLFPNQFPMHMVEQECLCGKCRDGASCLPNIDLQAVLVYNAEQCVYDEKLRPRVILCECMFTRDMSIF